MKSRMAEVNTLPNVHSDLGRNFLLLPTVRSLKLEGPKGVSGRAHFDQLSISLIFKAWQLSMNR